MRRSICQRRHERIQILLVNHKYLAFLSIVHQEWVSNNYLHFFLMGRDSSLTLSYHSEMTIQIDSCFPTTIKWWVKWFFIVFDKLENGIGLMTLVHCVCSFVLF